VPDPRTLRPDLPQGAVDIVFRAMEKIPEARYQEAAEMLAALETLLATSPESASSSGKWSRYPGPGAFEPPSSTGAGSSSGRMRAAAGPMPTPRGGLPNSATNADALTASATGLPRPSGASGFTAAPGGFADVVPMSGSGDGFPGPNRRPGTATAAGVNRGQPGGPPWALIGVSVAATCVAVLALVFILRGRGGDAKGRHEDPKTADAGKSGAGDKAHGTASTATPTAANPDHATPPENPDPRATTPEKKTQPPESVGVTKTPPTDPTPPVRTTPDTPTTPATKGTAGVMTPEEAAGKPLGTLCTVEMRIGHIQKLGKTDNFMLAANRGDTEPSSKAFVFFVGVGDASKFGDGDVFESLKKRYQGKLVRVTGKLESYKERPQIKLHSPAAIQVVDGR
jgi:hypothetical protein